MATTMDPPTTSIDLPPTGPPGAAHLAGPPVDPGAPGRGRRRPGREGGKAGFHRRIDIRRIGQHDLGLHLAGRGIVDIGAPRAGAGGALAADDMLDDPAHGSSPFVSRLYPQPIKP